MSDIDLHHLAAAYALDALDVDERRQFEGHYAACAVCSSDVSEFRQTLADLGELTSVAPPIDLKARVLAEIGSTRQLSPLVRAPSAQRTASAPVRFRPLFTVAAIAASLVLAAGVGVLAGRGEADSFANAAGALLSEPDLRMADMEGEDGSHVRVAWSQAAGRAIVTADGLPDPGEGRAYELWMIDADGPHPAGLLDHASNGDIERVLDVTIDGTQMGVTIEPESGSATPTAPILFSGEITA